jgi:hypothetical protein
MSEAINMEQMNNQTASIKMPISGISKSRMLITMRRV